MTKDRLADLLAMCSKDTCEPGGYGMGKITLEKTELRSILIQLQELAVEVVQLRRDKNHDSQAIRTLQSQLAKR